MASSSFTRPWKYLKSYLFAKCQIFTLESFIVTARNQRSGLMALTRNMSCNTSTHLTLLPLRWKPTNITKGWELNYFFLYSISCSQPYWSCNFSMNPHVRLLVRRSVIISWNTSILVSDHCCKIFMWTEAAPEFNDLFFWRVSASLSLIFRSVISLWTFMYVCWSVIIY